MNFEYENINIVESFLTIIRPIRVSEKTEYLLERINNHIYDKNIPNTISIIIVDDGSSPYYKNIIKKICINNKIGYIRLETEEKVFSPGRARNIGAIYAKSKYIFIQDIDLYPYENFYNNLLEQINLQGLEEDRSKFIMISCCYLNKDGISFLDNGSHKRYIKLLNDIILGRNEYIERISNGTSACVFSRDHFLYMGGFNENFEGWGYEDLDLNCRMIRKAVDFCLPTNWYIDKETFNTIYEYSGWKAIYRLYGDLTMRYGLILFHGTHPIEKNIARERLRIKNYDLFIKNLRILQNPNPLPDIYNGNTLIMKKCAFTVNPAIISYYGNIYFKDSYKLETIEDVINFLVNKKISRVIFLNPYSDELNRKVYKYVKEHNINYVICERGALPGSYFFDENGFLFDSTSYNSYNWDIDLNNEQRSKIIDYIRNLFIDNNSLEKQGERITVANLRKKYGIENKKIIFIPFQRPHDTAVEYFIRKNNYNEFINIVRELSSKINSDYVVLAKRHPLEDEDFDIPNIKYVNDIHINTLVEAADYIVTFTSGVGLLGISIGKVVCTVGNAFYSQNDLVFNVDSHLEIIEIIKNNRTKNKDKMLSFMYYLVFRFYSFGEFITRDEKYENGERITATIGIKNKIIRYKNKEIYFQDKKPHSGWNSILFDRYRTSKYFHINQQQIKSISHTSKIVQTKKMTTIKNENKDMLMIQNNDNRTFVQRFIAKTKKLLISPKKFFSDIKIIKYFNAS